MELLGLIRGNLMEYQKKILKNIAKSDSNFAPTFVDHHILPDINFNGHCLIKNEFSIPKTVINLDISYTLNPWLRNLNTYFTLKNYLFGSLKLTKNADPNKYKYSIYGMGFDSRSEFLFTDGSIGKNVIIFGADMSSSVHIDDKNKDVFVLGEGLAQGLDDTTLTTEAIYPIHFTQPNRRFQLSLHYNGSNSFLFVNATKTYQFKAKDPEIKDYALCLGNISNNFTINKMEKTRLKGIIKCFSIAFNPTDMNYILGIHRYLMKGNIVKNNVWNY